MNTHHAFFFVFTNICPSLFFTLTQKELMIEEKDTTVSVDRPKPLIVIMYPGFIQ